MLVGAFLIADSYSYWAVTTRHDLRMANAIMNYFEQLGIILDCGGSEYKNSEATVSFHCDRNNRLVLASDLNQHGEKLQELIHSINVPEFKFDDEAGLMLCYLQLSCKPPTELRN